MANPAKASTVAPKVENIIPILHVKDIGASLAFYTGALGFKLDWQAGNTASVSRDNCPLMLSGAAQGNPGTWLWMGVEDIEPLHQAFVAAGVKIRQQPTNYAWAYEMRIEDPDGHVLRMGSEPRADLPRAGGA